MCLHIANNHSARPQRIDLRKIQRLHGEQYISLGEHGGGRVSPFDPLVKRIRELCRDACAALEQHAGPRCG
jgi:hypothetical protein